MKIKKVLNNNAVIAVNEKGEEVVITGLGLAFKKKAGDGLEQEKIERVFRMENKEISRKLLDLINEIPVEYVEVTEAIVQAARKHLNAKLNENIYLTLTDHISFAVDRLQNQFIVTNPMVWEIKRFYMDEYKVGLKALDMIEERLGIRLPQDEAASIAMHIVNAQLNEEMPRVVNMIRIIQDALNIIKYHFGIELKEDSIDYQRLVTHLKFFAQRIMTSESSEIAEDSLFDIIRRQYVDSYECAVKIEKYAMEKYRFSASKSELTYLIVHIERVIHSHR